MSRLSIAITAASAVLAGITAYPVGKTVYASRYSPNSYCQGLDLSRVGGEAADPCAMDPGPQYYAQGGYITTPAGTPVAARPYVMQVKTKRIVAKKPLPRPRPKYPTVNRVPKDNSKQIINRVE
jgi:hypothetical protein